MNTSDRLSRLGWRPFFQSQVAAGSTLRPARVMHAHRGRVEVAHEAGVDEVALTGNAAGLGMTVGDWVLLDSEAARVRARLERQTLFQRRAAGTSGELQLIGANVDTLFLVTSANRDFNLARLERYLAIANDAGTFPVVVITKSDLAGDVTDYVRAARELAPGILVEALDARDAQQVAVLLPWCETGQTVALLGSSGVGKTTLINTLTGEHQATRAVRDDDQRGRHTTTARSMHRLPGGGWLMDTPGMRELQLVNVGDALDDVFNEIAVLARQCRFADCAHDTEPGCAVLAAIDAGGLDRVRLARYRKLRAEDRRNSESLAERRARDRDLGKMYKSVLAGKRHEKSGKY